MAENPFVKPTSHEITDVTLIYPKMDAQGMNIVVLERVEPGVTPDYCVHGKTTCIKCDEWCWLGDQTHDIVRSRQANPLCLQCATIMLPPESTPSRRIRDHRRADGPH